MSEHEENAADSDESIEFHLWYIVHLSALLFGTTSQENHDAFDLQINSHLARGDVAEAELAKRQYLKRIIRDLDSALPRLKAERALLDKPNVTWIDEEVYGLTCRIQAKQSILLGITNLGQVEAWEMQAGAKVNRGDEEGATIVTRNYLRRIEEETDKLIARAGGRALPMDRLNLPE